MNGPRTVLLIDDARDNVAICSVLLAHSGFRVIVAGDAAAVCCLPATATPPW